MDAERARSFLFGLPHVTDTLQWGESLVFWAADKVLGGKMFAVIRLDGHGDQVIAFAAGPERAAELCEREGLRPAPYLARAHWVAASDWDVLSGREWQAELRAAYEYVTGRLPLHTRRSLLLPKRELAALLAAKRADAVAKMPSQPKARGTERAMSAPGRKGAG